MYIVDNIKGEFSFSTYDELGTDKEIIKQKIYKLFDEINNEYGIDLFNIDMSDATIEEV